VSRRARKGFLWGAVVLAAMAAVAALLLLRQETEAREAVATATVKRGQLPITIETTGKVRAKESVTVYPEAESWDMRITWVIDEGKEVEKGDLLMKLEDKRLEEQVTDYEIRLERYRARVTEQEENLKIKKAEVEARLAGARHDVEKARTDLTVYGEVALDDEGFIDEEAYNSGDAPSKGEAYQSFREAELRIVQARTRLERAERNFDGMDQLLEKGFVTANAYRDGELAVTEAKRALESARLSHRILYEYTYPQQLAQKRAALERAQNALERAELEANAELLRAQSSLHSAERSLNYTQERYDEYKRWQDSLEVKAPVAGTVIYGDGENWYYQRRISVGERVWRGMPLFTIPDTSELLVESRVLEMDLYKVERGQEAVVTFGALPGAVFNGKITYIAQSTRGLSSWSTEKWKYFGVELALDQTDERVKPGMSCDVEIVIDRLEDALYVPTDAVFSRGERRFCTLVDGGAQRDVEVETGQSSEKYVEILSGLEEGRQVLLAGEPSGEEEQKAQVKTNGPR